MIVNFIHYTFYTFCVVYFYYRKVLHQNLSLLIILFYISGSCFIFSSDYNFRCGVNQKTFIRNRRNKPEKFIRKWTPKNQPVIKESVKEDNLFFCEFFCPMVTNPKFGILSQNPKKTSFSVIMLPPRVFVFFSSPTPKKRRNFHCCFEKRKIKFLPKAHVNNTRLFAFFNKPF